MSMLPALIPPITEGALVIPPVGRSRDYILEAESASTRRAYASDLRTFKAWCALRDLCAMPATGTTVADFLAEGADAGKAASTLGRRMAAIRYAHRLAGLETPTRLEEVCKTMRGIRRKIDCTPKRKRAATDDVVLKMVSTCDGSLIGLRDRALLALGFAGAFRRSELVALQVADLEPEKSGLMVTIRRSKTDQEGLGQRIGILAGRTIKPAASVQTWLAAAGITEGPIFRAVLRGNVLGGPLSGEAVARIVKKRATAAGLDPKPFAGHSLRAGFLTSAARTGATIFKMQAVSRHRSLEVMSGYVREVEHFTNHAGEPFL